MSPGTGRGEAPPARCVSSRRETPLLNRKAESHKAGLCTVRVQACYAAGDRTEATAGRGEGWPPFPGLGEGRGGKEGGLSL